MEYFIQQLINGITLGSIYGLIAIGYTMVYGIIGMINFAHGDIYKNIALVGSMLLAMFAIFGNLPESLYLELGMSESPALVMILLLLFMPVLGFLMMPIM